LDLDASDNRSVGGVSIDDTVGDIDFRKSKKETKNPFPQKKCPIEAKVRRIDSFRTGDKRMNSISQGRNTSNFVGGPKSKSTDLSAFCTPVRTIIKKMEMSSGDMSAITMLFDDNCDVVDDVSIHDTIHLPKEKNPKQIEGNADLVGRQRMSMGRPKSFLEPKFINAFDSSSPSERKPLGR